MLTLDQQALRAYGQLQRQGSDLAKKGAGCPRRVIPVSLDVGTDNEKLLNDYLYLGNRHARARGAAYDAFIRQYLETASSLFPNALLHFEDFGPGNARRILDAYGDTYRIFNDDMQGTGAIHPGAGPPTGERSRCWTRYSTSSRRSWSAHRPHTGVYPASHRGSVRRG